MMAEDEEVRRHAAQLVELFDGLVTVPNRAQVVRGLEEARALAAVADPSASGPAAGLVQAWEAAVHAVDFADRQWADPQCAGWADQCVATAVSGAMMVVTREGGEYPSCSHTPGHCPRRGRRDAAAAGPPPSPPPRPAMRRRSAREVRLTPRRASFHPRLPAEAEQ